MSYKYSGYNPSEVIKKMIDGKLLDLHTAFLGKVLSANEKTASVQPLGKIKQYGEEAKSQAPLSGVPIATYKLEKRTITTCDDGTVEDVAIIKPIEAGDIVVCICCDRDITEAKRGINGTPAIGHHSLSDSVIVGVL